MGCAKARSGGQFGGSSCTHPRALSASSIQSQGAPLFPSAHTLRGLTWTERGSGVWRQKDARSASESCDTVWSRSELCCTVLYERAYSREGRRATGEDAASRRERVDSEKLAGLALA